jgi:hypothetical protein
MKSPGRRTFMLRVVAGTSAIAVSPLALAQEGKEKVLETDPYAKSMGFKVDTNQVDKAKYPRHDAATQQCSKCQLYSGGPNDELGQCSFFKRLVPPTGWCKNFKVKKAA